MIDEVEVRKWWAVLKNFTTPLVEARVLGRNKTYSGYYSDVDTFIRDISRFDGVGGIYSPINTIKSSCYGRVQHDQIVERPKETTSDNDIDSRSLILIDIDPIRPSGVNSSEEEKQRAYAKAREIFKFLDDQGFYHPVIADSANGYHLYYRIDLPNNAETTAVVKDFLSALDMMFSDNTEGGAHIDTSVFNAGRIAKVIGTTTDKGADTPDRPRRMSRFLYIPRKFEDNDGAYVRKVAGLIPKVEQPDKYNRYRPERIDLHRFIQEHGIEVAKETSFSSGIKFILKECPFNSNHKAPDAALFQLNNGAIGFRCLHASCASYHWRDYRLLYEPDAYDKSASEDYNRRRAYNTPAKIEPVKPIVEDERGAVWKKASEYEFFDLRDAKAIPTGIPALDRKTLGLILGETTIITGGSGSGKTTFVNHLILNAVQRNYRTALWSGEMKGGRIVGWLDQMAAGKQNVVPIEGTDELYTVRNKNIREKINSWLGDRFYLYDNRYGRKWSHLLAEARKCFEENKINLAIFDNLMALELDPYGGENNDKQKAFISDLTDLAAKYNAHIVLIAHPKKEAAGQLIRKESVSGTSDLTNLAFNVILLHRVGQDFENRAKAFFGAGKVTEMMGYDLVVEVNKSRTAGCQDLLVGLYYEPETKRLKSDIAENIVYGWDDALPSLDTPPLPPPPPPTETLTPNYYWNDGESEEEDMPEF